MVTPRPKLVACRDDITRSGWYDKVAWAQAKSALCSGGNQVSVYGTNCVCANARVGSIDNDLSIAFIVLFLALSFPG